MRLLIVTKAGVALARDIMPEIVRRTKERGDFSEENVIAAYNEFESEMDAYAKELVKSPEYGEVAPQVE